MARVEIAISFLSLFFIGFLQQCSSTVLTAFPTNRLPITNLTLEGRAVKNFDPRYRPWPTPNNIPYMYDVASAYTTAEKAIIRAAMDQISTQMTNCIRFTEVPAANTGSGLYISRTFNPGTTAAATAPTTCQTVPGQHYRATTIPQKMIMIGNSGTGNNGCLATQREAMKLLVNALGLRDEWRRPLRDQCITVNPGSIDPAITASLAGLPVNSITDPYPTTGNGAVDVMGTTAYDFWSITIPAADKWKNPSAPVGSATQLWTYSSTQTSTCPAPNAGGAVGPGPIGPIGPTPVGTPLPVPPPGSLLAQLSQDDCRGLQAIYPTSCAAVVCTDSYNALPAPTAPLVAQPLPAAPAITAVAPGTVVGTPAGTGTVVGTPGAVISPALGPGGVPSLVGPGG